METKGLESLIPKKTFLDRAQSQGDIIYLDIKDIEPNPYQPRKTFSEENLKALSQSIKDYGILEPLLVSEKKRKTQQGLVVNYQLIAGERRLSAAKMAGLKKVPAIIKKLGDREKLEISLIENIQREDLNPIEKAEAFKELMTKFHLSLGKIAKIWGKSKGAVSNSLRLLGLPKDIQEALKEKKITEGHAKIMAGLSTQKQKEIYQNIIQKGLNVRETEQLVRQFKQKNEVKNKPRAASKNQDIANTLDRIKNYLNLKKADFSYQGKNIKVTFTFPSFKEFTNFSKKILP